MKQAILLFNDFDFDIPQDKCNKLKISWCPDAIIESNKGNEYIFNKYSLEVRLDQYIIDCLAKWYPDKVTIEYFDSAIENPIIQLDEDGSNKEVLSVRMK